LDKKTNKPETVQKRGVIKKKVKSYRKEHSGKEEEEKKKYICDSKP
jgi:hypothetical protein